MLYLVRSFLRGGRSILKIGYTADLKKRMSAYYHSNPGFELLAVREGGLMEEKKLQLYLEALGYKLSILEEWFQDLPAVLELFHQSRIKMEKIMWRERNRIFRKEDFKKGADIRVRPIYEELRMFYYYLLPGSKRNQGIDREYQMIRSQEQLKALNMYEEQNLYWE